MNLMLASGGYDWTVTRTGWLKTYMAALEKASVHGNVSDVTHFVAEELQAFTRYVPGSSGLV